jgi:two-component system chemotaxis response regulator CheB
VAPIRVLVVEDSLTVRRFLVDVLSADSELVVVGEAADGREAIDLCERLRPDVMTLDIVLPVLSGLAVTEHVMAYRPTPILIVSGSHNRGELWKTYDALAAGAVDCIDKPRDGEAEGAWVGRLRAAVKMVSRISVVTHPRAKLLALSDARSPTPRPRSSASALRMVALGASTGGPHALVHVLSRLARDFPLPIVVVLHIGPAFVVSLADWLDGQSGLRVTEAIDGEALPEPGRTHVFLAPAERHLVVERGRLRYSSAPERHSCRPSVDVLFESVAREVGAGAIGVLMTGMGRDGASGLLAMKSMGAPTIAQDEATSVVFGMPREAIQLGAVDQVLPLERIAPALEALVGVGRRLA